MPYADLDQRREAQRRYQAAHYEKNKQYYKDKAREKQREIAAEIRRRKEANPCTDCGKFYPYYVMEFDHLPGSEKVVHPARLYQYGSFSKMERELSKCELVCANCHRERTHQRSLGSCG